MRQGCNSKMVRFDGDKVSGVVLREAVLCVARTQPSLGKNYERTVVFRESMITPRGHSVVAPAGGVSLPRNHSSTL